MFVKRLYDHLLPETGYLRMIFVSDSAAIRTQDPIIKSDVLCLLSYGYQP